MEQLFPFLPADTHVGAGPAVALLVLPLLQNASATRLESFFGVCAVCPEPCHQDNPVFLVFVARKSLKTILAPLKSHFRVFLTHLLPFIGVILCHTVPPSVLCLVPTRFDVPRVPLWGLFSHRTPLQDLTLCPFSSRSTHNEMEKNR